MTVLVSILTVKECIMAEQVYKPIFEGSIAIYLLNKVKFERRGGEKEWINFIIRIMLQALEDANINTVIVGFFYTNVSVFLASTEVSLPNSSSNTWNWKKIKLSFSSDLQYFQN